MPFYVEDRTANQRIGPNPTSSNLIQWFWAEPPTGLYMIWRFDGGVTMSWNSNGASLEGSYTIRRRASGSTTWTDLEDIPATSVSYTDLTLPGSASCEYEVVYSYASATSAPSNILVVPPYDPAGGSSGNGNGGAGTPVGGTPPPGQDGPQDDPDQDGLTNAEEIEMGTDRTKADSDDDGVLDGNDGWPMAKFLNPPRLPVWRYAVIELVNGHEAEPIARNNDGDVIYQLPPPPTTQYPVPNPDLYYRAAGQATSVKIENLQFDSAEDEPKRLIGIADNGKVIGEWPRTNPSNSKTWTNFHWTPGASGITYSGDTCWVPGEFEPDPQKVIGAWNRHRMDGITPGGTVFGFGELSGTRYFPSRAATISGFAIGGELIKGYPQAALATAKPWIAAESDDAGGAFWAGGSNFINNSGEYINYSNGYASSGNAPSGPSPAKGYYYGRIGAYGTLASSGGGPALNDDVHLLTHTPSARDS